MPSGTLEKKKSEKSRLLSGSSMSNGHDKDASEDNDATKSQNSIKDDWNDTMECNQVEDDPEGFFLRDENKIPNEPSLKISNFTGNNKITEIIKWGNQVLADNKD